jgi:anti-anti-sigma regulatory factor
MQISVEQVQGRVPITVMALHGELDGSNFQDVIAKARELYAAGTRHLLLDLSGLSFMSSSGLVALHSIALLMQGQAPPDPEFGWQAFHALDGVGREGISQHIKLLNPQPKVERSLHITGMKELFEVHTERATALAAF